MPKQESKRKTDRKTNGRQKRGLQQKEMSQTKVSPYEGMTFSGSSNPYPSRFTTQFSSELFGSITAGVAAWTYTVSATKLYQPWSTSTPFPNPITFAAATLQPAGFTSLCSATAGYRTYCVVATKICVSVLSAQFADELLVAVAPIVSGTPYTTAAEASQGPYSKSRLTSSQAGLTNLSSSLPTNQFFGVRRETITEEDNYTALYNGTPVNVMDWQVIASTASGGNSANKYYYRINMYYDVVLETQSGPNLPDLRTGQVSDKEEKTEIRYVLVEPSTKSKGSTDSR